MKIYNFMYPCDFAVSRMGRVHSDICWVDIDKMIEYLKEFVFDDLKWTYYSHGLGSVTFATKEGSHMDLTTNALFLRFVEKKFHQKKRKKAA